MAFERVASLRDIPSEGGLRIRAGDRDIGLYRVGDRVYAMDDRCPHAGYPLSEGDLVGTLVICPGHAWEFDLETGLGPGEVAEPPLERFPVKVEGDDVLIDAAAPLGT
jgi:nitrite reductase/ring-hydroxylating ferredoxin subunit